MLKRTSSARGRGCKRHAARTIRNWPRPLDFPGLAKIIDGWPDRGLGPSERIEIEHKRPGQNPGGFRKDERPRPPAASPRVCGDPHQVLDWLLWLDVDERGIVFGKALGFGFRRIARVDPLGSPKRAD